MFVNNQTIKLAKCVTVRIITYIETKEGLKMDCPISQQIAEHCDDKEVVCPDCGSEHYTEERHHPGIGKYITCTNCGWDDANDVFKGDK